MRAAQRDRDAAWRDYIPAFIRVPSGDPIVQRRLPRPHLQRNPWNRLSVARTLAFRQAPTTARTGSGADPAAPLVLPDFFREHVIDDIDVVTIDVDGADFDILQSLADTLRERQVLAVGAEVNFVGSHEETDHTFHNTDRLMWSLGFDLFRLTVRPYSAAALPAPYPRNHPGPSVSGRPVQGDALYVRDLGDPEQGAAALEFCPAKLAKLCAIYALFWLYDCAAEVLVTHGDRLDDLLDVSKLLDVLCAEAQQGRKTRLSYEEYMAVFERDEPMVYSGR